MRFTSGAGREFGSTRLSISAQERGLAMKRFNRNRIDPEFEVRLNAAFADLRKQGFLVRKNFLCCQSCAGYSLSEKAGELVRAGKEFKGIVYYHNQDNANKKEGEDFYLAYGSVHHSTLGLLGLPSVEVGRAVVETFAERGLETEWNGDDTDRILVRNGVVNHPPLEFSI